MAQAEKRVVDELYLHLSAVDRYGGDNIASEVRRRVAELPDSDRPLPNVAKVNIKTGRLSLLHYPEFESDAFPVLSASWSFQDTGSPTPLFRTYSQSLNPPILHRKELLVTEDYPGRAHWLALTKTAESLGLFDDTTTIGFKVNWDRLIASKGYRFDGTQFLPIGNLVEGESGDGYSDEAPIQRHLTALTRTGLSAPVQQLIRVGLLATDRSFFDYGCGRGQDFETLSTNGYPARGWDPYFAATNSIESADVVTKMVHQLKHFSNHTKSGEV